ncbi:carbohydrate ABC transporter permease [Ketogulonicigenium vulgare]|uniref:Sugar ABC transporter, permease protein n=1 Tax=Ketogulonicigenium vulgare (strain WSH-001) TaxID=759362 RepID=F9Y4W0_KETVW|nr:sugar ABC transporter permease [Ketogulonicigenium vulgare]ADO43568.1 probable sugar ABC transporter, permease protein [Ketogulonicigenium vulgare Y25]AEM41844.1 sugar ABC transporter, permease protein [Ketogulonicigenium vulgare WSH-001]ALJ81950.1 sugar ABC transporter permease [Ketogulonicigenium vulgare]ANW34591.1 sugar ABC transporter permease [Ketogulonicigenium vulgare]AOZ55602.1 sugar ABC transporter permease [Ketogulonicigenium vulgare]
MSTAPDLTTIAPRRSGLRLTGRGMWITFLLVPPMAVMGLFVIYPILSAFAYAFFDWNGLRRGDFVGLQNFATILFDPVYSGTLWNAFRNNIIVFVALMVIQNGLGFVLAYCLWRELPGARFHRVAVFLPVVLSTVIIGYLWKLFFHPIFGVVNQLLKSVGLDALAQPWLGQAETALPALIFVNAWAWVGFPTLVFLAGLQRIPSELLDAARMETDSEVTLIRKIIWPLIAPSATIVFVLLFIGAFNFFELPYIMVGLEGSPYGSSDVLGLMFYRTAFGNVSSATQQFGLGSALAVLMFLFIAVFATIWTMHLRKREIEV